MPSIFTILFIVEGEGVGHERQWLAAPRIGETIFLRGADKATKVVDVVWHEMPDGVQARVHLEPNVLKSVR